MKKASMAVLASCGVVALVCSSGLAAASSPEATSKSTQKSGSSAAMDVTGPIPVTKQSRPSAAAAYQLKPTNLARWGYSEREYFVGGRANVYDWDAAGEPSVQSTGLPYKTRMLVRAPKNPAKWSGNVVVEIIHPSWDASLTYQWISSRHFLQNGDVWVGINAEGESQIGMKTFDPQRYASLFYPAPVVADYPADLQECAGSTTYENGIAWDIVTQTGALFSSTKAQNPIRSLLQKSQRPEKLILTGFSHTAFMTAAYAHTFNDMAVDSRGKRIWDGYFITGGGQGIRQPINACASNLAITDPRNTEPIQAHVMVESEENTVIRNHTRLLAWRAPDSNDPRHPYRAYEIPGLAHDVIGEGNPLAGPEEQTRMGLAPDAIAAVGQSCLDTPGFAPLSQINNYPLAALRMAMWRNLEDWIRHGKTPPPGRVIAGEVFGEPGALDINIDRDQFGNALGGVRLPLVDAPTETLQAVYNSGVCPDFDGYIGLDIPLSDDVLREQYPTHRAYVKAVTAAVRDAVQRRDLLKQDGLQMIQEASKSQIP